MMWRMSTTRRWRGRSERTGSIPKKGAKAVRSQKIGCVGGYLHILNGVNYDRKVFMSKSLSYVSQDNIVEVEDTKICSTSDYRMFRLDRHNRPIVPEHVDNLVESIKRKNLLHLFPIIVDMNFTIIDGQHRAEAARALGVPVYYVVSRQITIADVPSTTSVNKKWEAKEYLHFFCVQGKSNYLAVRELWAKYSFLHLNQIMQLCYSGDVKQIYPSWRDGTYKANAIPFCIKVAEAAASFKRWEHIDFYAHKSFVGALANLVANKNYSHERLMQKMEYLSRRLVKCADTQSYIACINDIYNYKVLSDNRVELKKLNANDKDLDRNR